MGIAGLLPQLRSITHRGHVSRYRGQTVAVDAYCLLHRGAYTCARELVEGEATERHVLYCMARIDLLTGGGVTPLVVFDGGRLPNKADEERSRKRNREENKARARQLWQQGNKTAAVECYQRAVDITPSHAKQFVEALKRRGIQFVVAPFEADAQMAYLVLNGLADVVLTEDSDLLCYGCPTVFFKMDKAGEGEEVRLADLPQAKELAFQGFGHQLFQEMCVLAGCDFADSLPGIGIKKAHGHLRRTRCFLKVVRSLRFDGTKIPEGYERQVQRALWTFRHQRVYCPRRKAVVHLHEVEGGDLAAGALVPAAAQLVGGEPDFLGPAMPDHVAEGIAVGDLDPITWQPFSDHLQPGTASPPLEGDEAAGSGSSMLAARPSGLLRQKHGKGGSKQPALGAGNGGNTLTNYMGFLRGLSKPAAPADFKPPRAGSSQPDSGSQGGSGTAVPGGSGQQQPEADTNSSGQSQQQQQQQQQRQQPQQRSAPASPQPAAQPAAGAADRLASPTEEQWQSFRREAARRQRHRSSSRAAAAAAGPSSVAARPMVPAASRCLAAPSGVRRPAGAAPGGLVARLKAALGPQLAPPDILAGALQASPPSPSLDDVLGSRLAGAESRVQQPPPQAAAARSPLEGLGLVPSPTIDSILGAEAEGGRAAAGGSPSQQGRGGGEGLQPPSSPEGGSPVAPFRASLRQWLPLVQHQQRAQQVLDLVSTPGGVAAPQQQQQQQQQLEEEGGVTPGFYLGGSSEAGSGARHLSSVPACRLPAGTPEPPGSGDPIASLSHVAAFEDEAEAAVERAAQVALAAAEQKTLRPLPPPPHLRLEFTPPGSTGQGDSGGRRQQASSSLVATKRPLLAGRVAADKENLRADGGKRRRSSQLAANPFSSFACVPGSA